MRVRGLDALTDFLDRKIKLQDQKNLGTEIEHLEQVAGLVDLRVRKQIFYDFNVFFAKGLQEGRFYTFEGLFEIKQLEQLDNQFEKLYLQLMINM